MSAPNGPSVAALEVLALRMMRSGSSVRQVTEETGLSKDALAALVRDFPAASTSGSAVLESPRPAAAATTELPVRSLVAHPANIRDDLGDLRELAKTIADHGVLQSLLVTRGEQGQYVILDGHRRLGAAIMAGLQRVPVTVRGPASEEQATVVMLVTGLQKLALDPLEEAMAYQRLMRLGRTQQEVSDLVGKNQGHISQRLALLNLTPAERAALQRKELTLGDAYRAGRDRSARRRPEDTKRPKPKRVPHFTREHPLAAAAAAFCGHEVTLKLGVACGPCWERVIRDDVVTLFQETAETVAPPQQRVSGWQRDG